MLIVNSLTIFKCRSCWKYLSRLVSTNSNNLFFSTHRSNKFVIRSAHDNIESTYVYKRIENEYYHSFLTKNKKYVASIAFLDYINEQNPPTDVAFLNEDFDKQHGITLMTYLHGALRHSQQNPGILDDARFINLCDALKSKISSINEDHTLNILKILTLWDQSRRNQAFFDICKSIDKAIGIRYRTWGFDKCLLTMDHFYRLQVLRFSEFAWQAMKRLWRDPNRY